MSTPAPLAAQSCTTCHTGMPTLGAEEVTTLLHDLGAGWAAADGLHLTRRFAFRSFAPAFAAATRVALIAESQGHHPDMSVGWGYLEISLTTHAAAGLTHNDFILAARVDKALDR